VSLLDTLRTAVKIADKVTKPVQSTVSYERYVSSTDDGTITRAAAVPLRAIVDWRKTQVRTSTGVLSTTRPQVMFLDIAALVAATAGNGVSDHDKITLQDGMTGPVINLSGFIDAGTGKPIATECFLG
jgi:hypothetical protein